MSESSKFLSPDELLRSRNPVPNPPSGAEIDTALRRVLRSLPPTPPPPQHPSWRLRPRRVITGASALAMIVAGFVFAAVNLLPASTTPGAVGSAWAKRALANAISAAGGNRTGILHVVETVSGFDPKPLTGQVWQTETAQYQFWVITDFDTHTLTTTIADGKIEEYFPGSNLLPGGTIEEVNESAHAPLFGPTWWFVDPEYQAAVALTHERGALPVYEPPTAPGTRAPQTFGDLIVGLLRTQGVRVARTRLNGEPAIKFSRTVDVKSETTTQYTLYVKPKTYRPLELIAIEASGNSSPPRTTITRFSQYETLPAGSVKMPNLTKLYPHAHVVHVQNGRVIKR
jgi:hypothetical protein